MPIIKIYYDSKAGKISAHPEIGQTDRVDQKIKWLLDSDDPNIVFASNGIEPIAAPGPPPPGPPSPPAPPGTVWSNWPAAATFKNVGANAFECDMNYKVQQEPAQWYRYMIHLAPKDASVADAEQLARLAEPFRLTSKETGLDYDPDIENQPKP